MKLTTLMAVPHNEQRYNTVGDWFYPDEDRLVIKVSGMSDWRYEALVAIHELIEAVLCECWGISQQAVDKFDMEFDEESEPGDSLQAPYHAEHVFAECIERLLAHEMGVDWNCYTDEVAKLG